jgi:hypothetical protein
MTYSPYRGSLTAAAIDMRRRWSGGAASHRPHGVSAPGRLFRPGRPPLRSACIERSREWTILSTIVNN